MAFRTATSRRAGAVILGTLAVLIAAALATGRPGPVLAATPTAALVAPGTNLLINPQATVGRSRLKAGTPSQFPAGRSRAACPPSSAAGPRDFRKPPNPGLLTIAISSPAAQAVPRNSRDRCDRTRRETGHAPNFYAEEHPSDANYLALVGGSAFGVPLADPEEENPLYNIDAANIGDLASPATIPNFAWVAPDDCADMEGCGIAAGDEFPKTELTAIMNSPAWTSQRSLRPAAERHSQFRTV